MTMRKAVGSRGALRPWVVGALLAITTPAVLANSTGISGYSGSSANCTSCHTGSSYFGYSAAFSGGSSTVAPGGSSTYTFSLTRSNGPMAANAGFNVSASGGSFTAGTAQQVLGGELTHTGPAVTGGGSAAWSIEFAAPATVGTVTLYGCGNPVAVDGDTTNDGPARCNTRTITINRSPTATNDAMSVAKNSSNNSYSVLDNDFSGTGSNDSGDSISLTSVSTASHGTTSRVGNTIRYTPTAGYAGSDSFTYVVTDSLGATDTGTVTVTVTNSAPVGVVDSYGATEDTVLTVNAASGVLANDTDANGDALTASVVSSPSKGILNLASNGSFTYTPSSNQTGSDSFVYRANDGSANSSNTTVNITISAVNDAPVANANSYNATEDTLLTVAVGSGVLANDTDAEGSALTAAVVSTTTHGTLTLNSNGSFTYLPAANYNGSDSFTYRANDGSLNSTAATVTLSIAAANDAPGAAADAYSTDEDTALVVNAASGVLANDGDVDGDTLSAVKDSDPAHGTLTLNSNGSFTYTPALDYNGPDSFTYHATDGLLSSPVRTVTLSVSSGNDPPTVGNDSYSLDEDGSLVVTAGGGVLANDSDLDSDPITAVLASGPAHGSLTLNANGSFTYTPAANWFGVDNFTYRANDGTVSSLLAATVTLTVNAVNDLPVIGSSAVTSATEDTAYSYDVQATDVETAGLVYTLTSSPDGMVINASNGLISWTPTNAQSGRSWPVTVEVSDGTATVSQSWTLDVTAVNDPPALAAIPAQSVVELSELSINAGTYASDVDDANDGNLAWSISAENAPGTVAITNRGVITYTPGQNTDGTWSVTVRLADGGEDSAAAATRTFSLTVVRLDGDGDGVANYNDNCVALANADQADNDGDGTGGGSGGISGGDACDSDDDNDGLSDVAELANLLDPFDAGDAATDLDGDGLSNLDEFLACLPADTDCVAISQDSVGPVITTGGDIEVVAEGYYTQVTVSATAAEISFGLPTAVTAVIDRLDGVDIPDTRALPPLRPGTHVLEWMASDAALPVPNVTRETQQVRIVPTITVGGTRVVGEGQTAGVRVLLNGESPQYPVTVDYTIGGLVDAADIGVATSGSITIPAGTEGWLYVPVVADGSGEGDETLVFTLAGVSGGKAALAGSAVTTVLVTEGPAAPRVGALDVVQGGDARRTVYRNDGTVTVSALATDPDGDVLSWDWSLSAPALAGTATGASFTFDPALVAAGAYDVVVRVSDGLHLVEQRATLHVLNALPVLVDDGSDTDGDGRSDYDEGVVDADDDGLLDYLDPVDSPEQVALAMTGTGAPRVAVAQPGVQLAAGARAVAGQGGGIQVQMSAVVDADGDPVSDPGHLHVAAVFDFELRNVPADGIASVVLPLPTALPPGAVWRKFLNGGWFDFVEGAGDALASAVPVNGNCPAFDDASWVDGLAAGHACVRLTLSDGGPNDADGVANGVIRDPSGPAIPEAAPPPAPPAGEVAGGSAGYWLVFLLALAGVYRARRKD